MCFSFVVWVRASVLSGATVSFSFLGKKARMRERERGRHERDVEARAARSVCPVPRADEPRRARTAASTVVALVSYFATDRLLRTNNLAINIYTHC